MEVYAAAEAHRLEEVPAAAQKAEALGFDGVLFNESTLDPFLAAALAAEHTRRTQLGTSIALAFPRSPMTTAYAAWNLQALARGRFQLGLGSQVRGHIQRRFSIPWSAPAPRMREYVQALRAIWACWQGGTPLDYRGEHYRFSLMPPYFNPGPLPCEPPQVHVAAVGPVMCRAAGEVGDGVLLHSLNSATYVQEVVLPNLEKGARQAGRTLKDLTVAGGGFIVVGANEHEAAQAYEATRRRVSFYASTPAYRRVLEIHGWGAAADELRQLSLGGRWEEMPRLVTEAMMEVFCVVGTYGDIAPKIVQRFGGYATRTTLSLPRDGAGEEGVRHVIQELHASGGR
jgi:probable F420-dependent oxidoreductase